MQETNVYLVNGGDDSGGVPVPGRLVPPGPHVSQALVRNQSLEQLAVHLGQLLGKQGVRDLQEVAVASGSHEYLPVGPEQSKKGWHRKIKFQEIVIELFTTE